MLDVREYRWSGLVLRMLWGLAAGAVLAATPPAGVAAEASHAVHFDIPAQPLTTALVQFSAQAGLQFTAPGESLGGIQTDGVRGEYPADRALDLLLKETGFTFRFVDHGTVAISSAKSSATASALRLTESETPGQASADSSREPKLEEVVVTAQKREERLQDVPIAISVISGRELDRTNIVNVNELLNVTVPGFATTHNSFPGTTLLSLRGVTAANVGASPIAYYVDSVPFGFVRSSRVPDVNGYDVDRVEALRGPESTLYGANAVNGVVRIITHDADLSRTEFKTRVSGSTMDGGGSSYRGDMAVNIPLIENKLAGRVAASYVNSAGWIDTLVKHDTNDTKVKDVRLKLNAAPSDDLSMGLSYWHSRTDLGAFNMGSDEDVYPGILDAPSVTRFDVTGLKIGYEFSGFSISSSTSYIDYGDHNNYDITPFSGPPFFVTAWYGTLGYNEFDSRVFSQEINLVSKTKGSWRWTAGAFYRDAKDHNFSTAPYIPEPTNTGDSSKSFAFFGELTREFLGGKLELTGGARYFRDKEANLADPPLPPPEDPSTFHHVSPRFVLTWHASTQTTAYASYGEGFRSGLAQDGFSRQNAPGYPPVKPDTLHNYEVGVKGALLDGRVTYDSAAYYVNWTDVQQNLVVPVALGIGASVLVNSETASGPGIDLNVITHPLDGLELGFNMNWNDLTFDGDVKTGLDNAILFHKGDRLNSSPEYTFGALAAYSFPLSTSGLLGRLSASHSYHAEQLVRSTTNVQRGDVLRNARVGFSIEKPQRWTAELFADNVTNDRGNIARLGPSFYNVRTPPRTIGLQFEYRFVK